MYVYVPTEVCSPYQCIVAFQFCHYHCQCLCLFLLSLSLCGGSSFGIQHTKKGKMWTAWSVTFGRSRYTKNYSIDVRKLNGFRKLRSKAFQNRRVFRKISIIGVGVAAKKKSFPKKSLQKTRSVLYLQ